MVSRFLAGAAFAGVLAWPAGAAGQGVAAVSRPVVQALPSEDSRKLNAALAQIGRDPRNVQALIEAGDAARGLNDSDAAIGFYRRADEISPANPRVKAGLGSAYVLAGDPVSAIPQFEAADRAGATPAAIAADRGLAYDLVGDGAAAQRSYALALPALSGAAADEVRIRLGISQAIAGNGDGAYATLLPLLNRQDKPGWRARAFTLAIGGDTAEAVDLAGKILPAPLAQNIAPYLRYMPRLTKAQQAAAANLGRFPRASEIGRDDPRIAAYAPPSPTAAGAGLIPKGDALGGGTSTRLGRADTAAGRARSRARSRKEAVAPAAARPVRRTEVAAADPDRVVPPEPKPAIERAGIELPPLAPGAELPPVTRSAPAPAPAPALAPAPAPTPPTTPAATPAAPLPRPAEAPAAATRRAPAPGFDLAHLPASTATARVAATPRPAPAPAASPAAPPTPTPTPAPAAPPRQLSLSEIFADLGKPAVEAAPVSGAVDIRKITPAAPPPRIELPKAEEPAPAPDKPAAPPAAAKGKPAADAKTKAADAKAADAKDAKDAKARAKKPAPPAHPSRIWVQIGVGRSEVAIAFDWRRYAREHPALFKGREPFVSEMGRTNRILVGPFASQKAASAFLAEAKKDGFPDALPWTSPAGQVVDPLSVK
ncbi:SPOR domain-containing protein [Novosphingobium soli]|uniref:SPOR domain-containing protein n=1 Tax=Novosphingobium soli TaxID=574956 RepID=A0ABV6CPT3_9SPHN